MLLPDRHEIRHDAIDEVAARRRLRLVHEAGIEAPSGEPWFEAREWLREVESDREWRESVVKVARALAKLFDESGTAQCKHSEISRRARLRKTATQDALRELDRAGWLGRQTQFGRGRRSIYSAFWRTYQGLALEGPEASKTPAENSRENSRPSRGRVDNGLDVERVNGGEVPLGGSSPNGDFFNGSSSQSSPVEGKEALPEDHETPAVVRGLDDAKMRDRARVAALEDVERPNDSSALGDNEPTRPTDDGEILHHVQNETTSRARGAIVEEDVPTHGVNDAPGELDQIVRDLERIAGQTLPHTVREGLREAFALTPDRIRAWRDALLDTPPEPRDTAAWIERAIWESVVGEISPDGELELRRELSEEWPADSYLRVYARPEPEPDPDPVAF